LRAEISTHIMQVEIYKDTAAFCQTPDYLRWRDLWQPPTQMVDLWVDHDLEMRPPANPMTPRQGYLTRMATRLPFHHLESLAIGDLRCVDLGCGHNWFQQFYPSIWGVDPIHPAHRDEPLTPAWWRANQGQWPRAFSICALHFCPQPAIMHQLARVRGLLAAGGRAWIALNRARIEERTRHYQEHQLRDQLAETPGLTRMVWLDGPSNASMDGNVWLWLEAGKGND
jgi:hypothetical protein